MKRIWPYVLCILALLCFTEASAQKKEKKKKKEKKEKRVKYQEDDTVHVKAGQFIIFSDTAYLSPTDTMIIEYDGKIIVKNNPYEKSDSFYDSLNSKEYRSKVTETVVGLLFRNTQAKVSDSINFIKGQEVFKPFEGKIIGEIQFTKIDILEGSVYDTSQVIETGLGRAFESIHTYTRTRVIRKNLYFKEGEKLDPFRLADNERILRRLPFIDDALITVVPRITTEDTVDVLVLTQDYFEWGLDGSFSSFKNFRIGMFNRNFLGRGDEIGGQFRYNDNEDPKIGYTAYYNFYNIWGTFTDARIAYRNDWREKSLIGSLNKPFLTPETKYGGGITLGDLSAFRDGRTAFDTISRRDALIPFSTYFVDAWVGRALILKKRKNIILSARYRWDNFYERPTDEIDPLNDIFFQDRHIILGSIGYTKRNFFKSNMIFNYGRTEDVPVGFRFELLAGYEFGEFHSWPYTGFEFSTGGYSKKLGWLGVGAGFGGFIYNNGLNRGTISLKSLYFTPLIDINRTRLRTFVRVNYVKGINRDSTDLLSLRDELAGVSGRKYLGDEKLGLTTEWVFFTPVYFYRWRLVAFGFADVGWLTFDSELINKKNFYYGLGAGIRLRNDSFIIRTISISLAYYPQIQDASTIFKLRLDARDPQLFDRYTIDRPAPVLYQ